MDAKIKIAMRAAKEIEDGDVVNLGIGMPTLIADYIDENFHVILHSENGILGMGKSAEEHNKDKNVINAGGTHVSVSKGGSFFDTATSFGIIRGGHVDKTFLGALQVDSSGSLASHIIPNKLVPGMGGAMDLVAGAKNVIVVTTHTAKDAPKILKQCTLPLTAYQKVNKIITELAVIECTPNGLLLTEIAEETTLSDVIAKTEAVLTVAENLKTF